MLFTSLQFIFFLPAVVVLYYLLNHRYRWLLLLIASYYFYMCWKAEYVVLILGSTIVDYLVAIKISRSESTMVKRILLSISIFTNLGLLFSFKYFNFFSQAFTAILNRFNLFYDAPVFHVLLPVGISFYTFQTMSYTIDVYHGNKEPEYHFGIFAVFVSFFPQLVAGPIERASNLIPQLKNRVKIEYQNIAGGLKIMFWGFFLKMVVADRLALYVNEVYNNLEQYNGTQILLGTYFFSYQIYCDFAGYSLIAIGSARLLGVRLMQNFRTPYYSKSIPEFWKRWHISLSTWFKDYLYIPLGGNRVIKWRWYYNLFITFLVSGLWHGANWTFIIWGALHGIYMIVYYVSSINSKRISGNKYINVFFTFNLVLFAWIFFRANSFHDAFHVIKKIFSIDQLSSYFTLPNFNHYMICISIASIIFIEIVQLYLRNRTLENILSDKSAGLRYTIYSLVILFFLNFAMFHNPNSFIYFQF
jgi:alginate O-acetyltransferase complex protein AlgI